MSGGIPRLHVVTADETLATPGFIEQADALLATHGPSVALHLRGHATSCALLHQLAAELAGTAREAGSLLLVNDRADVALATGCHIQLGRRSLPIRVVRELLGAHVRIGFSAHDVDEAVGSAGDGADFVLLGTIWPSASHPGGPTSGPEVLGPAAARAGVPVLAIGGVTVDRSAEALEAGAHGVAVISGVWDRPDPVMAAAEYLEAMGVKR